MQTSKSAVFRLLQTVDEAAVCSPVIRRCRRSERHARHPDDPGGMCVPVLALGQSQRLRDRGYLEADHRRKAEDGRLACVVRSGIKVGATRSGAKSHQLALSGLELERNPGYRHRVGTSSLEEK